MLFRSGTGTWTDTDFTKSHIDFMVVLPMLVDQEILRHIWEQRPLLGVKAGLPVEQIEDTKGRSLGLAHPVFTLGLEALREGDPRAAQTGVRVIEFERETPRAFYDVAHDEKKVRLYLEESFTFLLLTTEASVALNAGDGKAKAKS